jgi:hypothetical protein
VLTAMIPEIEDGRDILLVSPKGEGKTALGATLGVALGAILGCKVGNTHCNVLGDALGCELGAEVAFKPSGALGSSECERSVSLLCERSMVG